MEGSRPAPDETEKSSSTKSAKAENVAAWLSRQRDDERHVILGDVLEDNEHDEKDGKSKKSKRMRLGALPIVIDEPHVSEAAATHQENEDEPKNSEADGTEYVIEAKDAHALHAPIEASIKQYSETVEDDGHDAADRVSTYDATAEVASTAELEHLDDQQADFDEQEAEDFAQWEQQVEANGPVNEHIDETDSVDDAHNTPRTSFSHSSRPTPSTRSRYGHPFSMPVAPPVAGGAGGGGGNSIPPTPGGPNNPFEPHNDPNMYPVSSANTVPIPVSPNVLGGATPNVLHSHEHEHGHPRLALAMAAGLLVEHMLGKRADKRIDSEMRRRTDKLREQIEHTQATQAEARTALEARQMRAAVEQDRQRQVVEGLQAGAASQVHTEARMPSTRPVSETAAHTGPVVEVSNSSQHVETQVIDTNTFAEAHVRPNIVMEQVAAAAENDSPVERVYERRQEIRDEPSTPAGAAAGGAAGSDNGSQTSGSGQFSISTASISQDVSNNSAQRAGGPQNPDYQAAIVRGIGAAIALIVLALLAYLFV
jgi:hypothetical protein